MSHRAKPQEPIAISVPGWSISDRFLCIRGRIWRVVGFERSTSGPLLRGECVVGSDESDCPISPALFEPGCVARLEEI